ncbi:hypothetical protein QQS21_007146 [Conoideocrella luteorostrata]|uniref:Uncharacterized protein n=1 Tax=Conoideocrella luteorostrata TaxID=1105319 RepID=A0AAJ0CLL9_9HYPO|nr:hypothetical protein QQS21_007146 [Conoideocrella luteorostrata]
MSHERQPLTYEGMGKALALLDVKIASNDLLMSVAPIRLITVGGCLAVRLCHSREASYDIDCLLDPHVTAVQDYSAEFEQVVREVAREGGFYRDWLNQQVSIFVSRGRRTSLFFESVQQDIAVYRGRNLVVYAGRLDWALEGKVRRVSHSRSHRGCKDVDLPDAAALIHLMRKEGDKLPISFQYVRDLNFNGFDVGPKEEALKEIAKYYFEEYGEVGLAEMSWDNDLGKWKYQADDETWVWY